MPKKRVKATPEKMITAWIWSQKGYSFIAIGKHIGCNDNTASRWTRIVENNPTLLKQAKELLAKNISVPTKTTKSSRVREWIKANLKGTRAECEKALKIKISSSLFSTQRGVVTGRCTPSGSKIDSSSNGKPVTRKPAKISANVIKTQEDEIAFLRWWNSGERQGFVSRLLDELEK